MDTYHAHTLQVHFSTPQLLPAVMAVTLAFGQAAEVTRELKDITYKRAPTYLISWHLQGNRGSGMNGGGQEGRKERIEFREYRGMEKEKRDDERKKGEERGVIRQAK